MIRLSSYYWELRYRIRKWLWDRASKSSTINGIALMFHHVSDKHVDINESCQCTINHFKQVLEKLQREGRSFVSCDTMMTMIRNKDNTPFTVVTFDDVPDNFYINAYPILKQQGIPFVLFITSNFVGKPGYLTKKQLRELDKDSLCTIGAHTISHPMLRRVKDSYYEISESKKYLEALLLHPVNYFAYPFGRQSSVSGRIKKEVRRAGFTCAFGTIQSKISDTSTKSFYYIPRIVL